MHFSAPCSPEITGILKHILGPHFGGTCPNPHALTQVHYSAEPMTAALNLSDFIHQCGKLFELHMYKCMQYSL